MEKIAIYGKGGVGKSVVATNLSVHYALHGKRILHVGCDPKHDSSIRLLGNGLPLRTVLDVLADDPNGTAGEDIINKGRFGIECCEAGGPPPGQGCGGRGVARTIEYLGDTGLLTSGRYDVVLFDVLGDVVCGGFAAPLRLGFAEKVFIVVSEEPMALFAANNICKAIRTYSENGIVLGGLIANLRSNAADRSSLTRFAEALSTRILAFVPRDDLVMEAERHRMTVIERHPGSAASNVLERLGSDILEIDRSCVGLPTPLDDSEFFKMISNEGGTGS